MDVAEWLRGLGLEQYAPAFRDNDIDGEVLRRLTGEDLRELGVSSIGHRRRLLDAIAAGQITPGPLSTTATLVGYLLAGHPGSVVATVAIFLPAFFLVAISGPFVPRLRQSRLTGAALDGVNVAALALMIVVTYQLARAAFVDWPTAALGMLSLWLLLRYRLNSR